MKWSYSNDYTHTRNQHDLWLSDSQLWSVSLLLENHQSSDFWSCCSLSSSDSHAATQTLSHNLHTESDMMSESQCHWQWLDWELTVSWKLADS